MKLRATGPLFIASLAMSLLGSLVVPALFQNLLAGDTPTDIFLYIALVVAVALLAMFLFSAFFKNTSDGSLAFAYTLKRISLAAVLGLALMLAVSTVYGSIAVFIYAVSGDTLDLGQIKGIINICTSILTLLIMPIYVHTALEYITHDNPLKDSLITSWQTLKTQYYTKILFSLMALFALGVLVSIPFRYAPQTVPLIVLKSIAIALLGFAGLIHILSLYKNAGESGEQLHADLETMQSESDDKSVDVDDLIAREESP